MGEFLEPLQCILGVVDHQTVQCQGAAGLGADRGLARGAPLVAKQRTHETYRLYFSCKQIHIGVYMRLPAKIRVFIFFHGPCIFQRQLLSLFILNFKLQQKSFNIYLAILKCNKLTENQRCLYLHLLRIFSLFLQKPECVQTSTDRT